MRYGVSSFTPPTSGSTRSVTRPISASKPARTEDADAVDARAPGAALDLEDAALDALIARVEHARAHQLALSGEDLAQLLAALKTLAHLNERLDNSDLTIVKLKRLLGMTRSSESTRDVADKAGGNKDGDRKGGGRNKDGAGAGADDKKNQRGKGRGKGSGGRGPAKPRPKPAPPEVHQHPITGIEKGASCGDCGRGRLYKFEPATFTRVRGNPLYTTERHVMAQLRCNACQKVHTAELPSDVVADGGREQRYGWSAVALMGIMRYFSGEPFFRSMTIQGLLGLSLSASTIFDQCERLSTALNPVYKALKREAAKAAFMHIDDTTHRILEAQPVERTRNGVTRLRSGVYASALLALVHDPPRADGGGGAESDTERSIVVFRTDIGHAGEWLDEILGLRPAGMAAPVVMSDALSSNRTSGHEVVRAGCNAHARRGFHEVSDSYPDEALHALLLYQQVWVNDAHCREQKLSPEARLAYHQEHSAPVMQELHGWCTEQLDSGAAEANGTLGKAMRYVQNHYEALTLFLRVAGAPVDNNVIERLIKLVVRSRKNSHFYRSEVGAGVSDVITSVLASCHENDINGFHYLVALQRHAAAVRKTPERWLPWNYEAAVAEIESGKAEQRAAA